MEVPQKYQALQMHLSSCFTVRLGATTTVHVRRIEEKDMSVSQALGAPVDEIMESIELVRRACFDAATTRCCCDWDALQPVPEGAEGSRARLSTFCRPMSRACQSQVRALALLGPVAAGVKAAPVFPHFACLGGRDDAPSQLQQQLFGGGTGERVGGGVGQSIGGAPA